MGIILVTGRGDRIDRIVGLEMGADDYVTKPLELRELVVRVKNLLWRIDLARQAQPHTQDNCYRFCRLLPECVAPYAGAGWRAD